MGCRIVAGIRDGWKPGAALYCSTSDTAFGPVLDDEDHAERVIKYCSEQWGKDPRELTNEQLRWAASETRDEE